MPVYTIKEFSDLVDIPPKNLHTYATRRKLIKNTNGQIDTNNPINEAFFESRKKDTTKPIKKPAVKKNNSKKKLKTGKKDKEEDLFSGTPESFTELDRLNKKLTNEKLLKDIAIKNEDLKKKRGEVIESEVAITIATSYADNLKRDYVQHVQTLIQDICARHGISSQKAGDYKIKVYEIINNANKSSISILRDLE